MSLVYPEIWITPFGALENYLWTKQSRMVQQPQNRQHASSPSNLIKPSHASCNLFHLPTHNSTYHLASTTRDLSTNLGFKILCSWRTPKENHQEALGSTSLQAFMHKNQLGKVGSSLPWELLVCLAQGWRRNGEKNGRRSRPNVMKKWPTFPFFPFIYFVPKLIKLFA